MSAATTAQVCDVVVVGAGPAGCAAAATASRQGCSVVVPNRSPEDPVPEADPGWRAGEGAAPGTAALIDEIFGRASGAFHPERHLLCPGIVSTWGSPEPASTEHLLNPLGPAWHLDRPRFDADLRTGARAAGAVVWTAVTGAVARDGPGGGEWVVRTAAPAGGAAAPGRADAGSIKARVVIDAGGRGSRVARSFGAHDHQLDRLVALGARWPVGGDDVAASTYVEAAAQGWWYSALLPGHRRLVVYLTDADLLPTGRDERHRLVQSARRLPLLGPVLAHGDGPTVVEGPRLVAARSGWLDRFEGDEWLAAGDAAFAVDPLSGQGVVSALVTGRSAGLAAAAMASGGDGTTERTRHRRELTANLRQALDGHQATYRAEGRWPEQAFWARRR